MLGLHLLKRLELLFKSSFFNNAIIAISFFIYFSHYFIYGENSNVLIHDNFDSVWIWWKLLSNYGEVLGGPLNQVPAILNGVPRASLPPNSYIDLLLTTFDLFNTYVLNKIIQSIIGFLGMRLLLKNHFSSYKVDVPFFINGASLCFAFLPHYPPGLLSVAGLPLVFNSFLNIRLYKDSRLDWIIILIFPLCSHLALTGIFIGIIVFCLFLKDLIFRKILNLNLFLSIFLLTISYCVVEYRLFYITFFDNTYISHRADFIAKYKPFSVVWGNIKHNLLYGHYQVKTLHKYYILLSVIIAGMIMLFKKSFDKKYVYLASIIILSSLIYGFYDWIVFKDLREDIFILNAFNFKRFHWLHPLYWYLIFYVSIVHIFKFFSKSIIFIYLLIFLQLSLVFKYHEVSNYHETNESSIGVEVPMSYSKFFAIEQFEKIKNFIDKPTNSYRVISLGFPPSITQNSGFFTLDGFLVNYPLKYKHDFRKIMEEELGKSEKWRLFFDNWGSRCYLFSHELERESYTKDIKKEINDLSLNTYQLKKMNCQFVLSSVHINNASKTGLKLIKTFIDSESYWDIFLYKVI